jgi:3-hydroxyisobutyrate dehydrogenase
MQAIGVIGLGNMGRGMALALQRAGFSVLGTAASPVTRAKRAKEGIAVADSLAEVAANADVIVLALPTPASVEQVVIGPDGLLAHGRRGLLVIDTTTSHPDLTRALADRLAGAGIALIDAPVSGAPEVALAGGLTMMIGGADADVVRAQPVLAALSAKRIHLGAVGAGHTAKLANNLLVASHFIMAAEVVRMAKEAGVATDQFIQVVNASSGRSFVTEHAFPKWILSGTFDLGFTAKLMRKDVRLAGDMIDKLKLDLPLVAEAVRLWADSAATLGDDEDVTRVVELGTRARNLAAAQASVSNNPRNGS